MSLLNETTPVAQRAGNGDNLPLAISAILFTVVIIALSDVIVKVFSDSIGIWQLLILRSLIVLPVLISYVVFCKPTNLHWPVSWFWISLRSFLLVSMWVIYYWSLQHLTLANATAAFHTFPIFIGLITLCAGERMGKAGWISVFLGIAGATFILQPTSSTFDRFGLLALLAALLYALAMSVTRIKCRNEHPVVLSLILNLFFIYMGMIALGLLFFVSDPADQSFLFAPWEVIDNEIWLIAGVLSVFHVFGSIGIVIAYQNAPSSTISVFDLSQVGVALLLGVLFLNEVPTFGSLIGIILIVLAGTVSLHPGIFFDIKDRLLGSYRYFLGYFVSHHNKIQFVGYEVANLVLLADTYLTRGDSSERGITEASAAFFFLIGSACIVRFDKIKRPYMLLFGGAGLILGGISLMLAGYWVTGAAVVVASLETARGGLVELTTHVSNNLQNGTPARSFTIRSLRLGAALFGWYVKAVTAITHRHKRLGGFINNRPFLTSSLIKAPFRLEFIVRKLFTGDYIGAAVGVSWMILGDGGLALNDEKIKQKIKDYTAATSVAPPLVGSRLAMPHRNMLKH